MQIQMQKMAWGMIFVLLSLADSFAFQNALVEKPNVVVIFTDDHRYDAIGALGNGQVKTPNIDKLIQGGTLFTNAYIQGANSGAVCAPSRAQLLTGRGVFALPDGNGHYFPETMTTFPTVFNDAGYFTFLTGKSHNGPEASMRGFAGGSTLYGLTNGYYLPHFRLPYQDFREDGAYGKEHLYFIDGTRHEIKLDPDSNLDHIGPHSSEIFAKSAIDFLQNYNRRQPFLLYLPFHAPHDTRNAPKEYHDMYPPEDIKLPDNFMPMHPFDNGDLYIRDEKLAPYPRTERDTKNQLADYYAIITHMDDQIGEVLEVLESKGMIDNTIIVFATDSGLGMGSHGLFGKQNLYEDAGIHVPIVFNGLGIPKNETRSDLCYTADIFPTLCELLEFDVPSSVTGISLAKSIKDPKAPKSRKELYFGYRHTQRGIRNERYKLIEYQINGKRHTQLFDLLTDPYEINDLSKRNDHQRIITHLRKMLQQHRVEGLEWEDNFWDQF
jgi:arylsulfatase A-like enzyme